MDKDAILQAPKRSLASLLPLSLKQAFTRAFLTDQSEVLWEGGGTPVRGSGVPSRLRLAHGVSSERSEPAADGGEQPPAGASSPSGPAVDREPLTSEAPVVRHATVVEPEFDLTAVARSSSSASDGRLKRDRSLERMAGTLVHRVFSLEVGDAAKRCGGGRPSGSAHAS